MYRLITFGGLRIESGGAPAPHLRRPWLAMLAVLAAARETGVPRERIIALFWPEADEEHARQSARQMFYGIRQAFGCEVFVTKGAALALDPHVLGSDVADFRAAIAASEHRQAVALATAPFLDGFYLAGAGAFERWAEEERNRLAEQRTSALVSLAVGATGATAVHWWRELTVADPLSGRFATGLLRALAEQGDRAEGLAFARRHETIVRRELEADPDPEVRRLEAALRAMPSPGPKAPSHEREIPQHATPTAARSGEPSHLRSPSGSALRNPWTRTAMVGAVLSVAALLVREQRSTTDGPFAAASSPSPTAARLYAEGMRSIDREDVVSARRFMRAALEDDSTFVLAAYQEAVLATKANDVTPDGRDATVARRTALTLAQRATERERLLITARLLTEDLSPAAYTVAESLAARFPDDAEALSVAALVQASAGEWQRSAELLERAVSLDSAMEPVGSAECRACPHLEQLGHMYLWWDSLPAAERTAARYLARRPKALAPLHLYTLVAARRGDSAATYQRFRRLIASTTSDRAWKLTLDLYLEDYETFAADIDQLLRSASQPDRANGAWLQLMALRNQGRLSEAQQFHRTGSPPGLPHADGSYTPDPFNAGILRFERGEYREAARFFRAIAPTAPPTTPAGHVARMLAWQGTLAGMALAAAGDTIAVRAMADSVERWGMQSLYGRDRRLHHFLRGQLHAAAGRHAEAVLAYRSAVNSATLGFTRVNFEMARSLLALNRPAEAVAILQPALRGELDASNLYVTRTSLHELLATAFDRAGQPDSAAQHWRAVVAAWRGADPEFAARRRIAVTHLARLDAHRRTVTAVLPAAR